MSRPRNNANKVLTTLDRCRHNVGMETTTDTTTAIAEAMEFAAASPDGAALDNARRLEFERRVREGIVAPLDLEVVR